MLEREVGSPLSRGGEVVGTSVGRDVNGVVRLVGWSDDVSLERELSSPVSTDVVLGVSEDNGRVVLSGVVPRSEVSSLDNELTMSVVDTLVLVVSLKRQLFGKTQQSVLHAAYTTDRQGASLYDNSPQHELPIIKLNS